MKGDIKKSDNFRESNLEKKQRTLPKIKQSRLRSVTLQGAIE